jgi:molybdopterin-guanine dinucleotide biosynthesis protein A
MPMVGAIVAIERETGASAQDVVGLEARPTRIERLVALLSELTDRIAVIGDAEARATQAEFVHAESELDAIRAAARLALDDHAVVMAADLAHPSAELVRYLVHIRGGHEAVVPVRRDGLPQPLCALYHGRCAGRAQGLVAAGERNAEALLGEIEVREVTVEEVAKFGEPEELLARI